MRNLLLLIMLCMVSLGMSFMLTEAIGFSEFSLNNSKVSNSAEILYLLVNASVSALPICNQGDDSLNL